MAFGAVFRRNNDASQPQTPPQRQRSSVTTFAAAIALISSITALGLFGAATAKTNYYYENVNTYTGDWTDGMCLIPAGLSILSSAIILALRSNLKPWHHLALRVFIPFLVVAMCIPSLVFAIAGGLFQFLQPTVAISGTDGVPSAFDCALVFNAFSYECMPVAYSIAKLEIAGIVFLFFVLISNFVIMAIAVVEPCTKRKVTYPETKEERVDSVAS